MCVYIYIYMSTTKCSRGPPAAAAEGREGAGISKCIPIHNICVYIYIHNVYIYIYMHIHI